MLLDSRYEILNAPVKIGLKKPDQVENIEFLNENCWPGLDKYKYESYMLRFIHAHNQ